MRFLLLYFIVIVKTGMGKKSQSKWYMFNKYFITNKLFGRRGRYAFIKKIYAHNLLPFVATRAESNNILCSFYALLLYIHIIIITHITCIITNKTARVIDWYTAKYINKRKCNIRIYQSPLPSSIVFGDIWFLFSVILHIRIRYTTKRNYI